MLTIVLTIMLTIVLTIVLTMLIVQECLHAMVRVCSAGIRDRGRRAVTASMDSTYPHLVIASVMMSGTTVR